MRVFILIGVTATSGDQRDKRDERDEMDKRDKRDKRDEMVHITRIQIWHTKGFRHGFV